MSDDDPDLPSVPAKDNVPAEPAPVAPTPSEDPPEELFTELEGAIEEHRGQ
jgi:hypothetical protein